MIRHVPTDTYFSNWMMDFEGSTIIGFNRGETMQDEYDNWEVIESEDASLVTPTLPTREAIRSGEEE